MSDGVDVLAIGAHPDDVEIGCGGTLALLAGRGLRVGILHLTSGEAGSRGTAEQRRAEARTAAAALGVAEPHYLDFGDGGLRGGPAEEDELVAVLRELHPELVLGPPPSDRHPDHGRAHRLVRDACFYAGLARRAPGRGGPSHRPAALFSYMGHDLLSPSFIVDVTAVWARKVAALDAYESQLHRPGGAAGEGPPTKVASREFRLALEGRARELGVLVGGAYGEGFWSARPLAVADPWTLLPGGLR